MENDIDDFPKSSGASRAILDPQTNKAWNK